MMLCWVVLILMASVTLAAPHKKLVERQVGRSAQPQYELVGCYRDTSDRAIPTLEGTDIRLDGNYGTRANPIQKCAEVAKDLGYSMFAVQNGGWCASSADAANTYNKYGTSSACTNGEGGGWANDVYRLIYNEGSASGDPHMMTFDGRQYSLQGVCWYTFFKDCATHPDFEVTAKFEPRVDTEQFKTRTVSFNVTVGVQYAIVNRRDVVTGSIEGGHVNSTAIHIKNYEQLITLIFKSKDTTFTLEWTPSKHLLKVAFSGTDYNGKICGLLGNADGDKRNDFQTPDGIEVNDATTFGESWKVNGKVCG